MCFLVVANIAKRVRTNADWAFALIKAYLKHFYEWAALSNCMLASSMARNLAGGSTDVRVDKSKKTRIASQVATHSSVPVLNRAFENVIDFVPRRSTRVPISTDPG